MTEKVKVIIFVNSDEEGVKYLKLFRFMLKDKVTSLRNARYDKIIETDDFIISILQANNSARGHRAHYVLNLTQDEDFDSTIAKVIERFEYLDYMKDQKWKDLY